MALSATLAIRKQSFRVTADQVLAAMLLAACVAVPLLFTIALQDSFALPKVTAVRILVVIGVLLLGARLIAGRIRNQFALSRIDLAVLAFVLFNVLAFIFSTDRSQSLNGERLQYQGLLTILSYVGFFYLARATFRTEGRTVLLFSSIAVGGTVVAMYGLVQKAGLDPIWNYAPGGRVFSTVGQPNALAAYLVLAITLSAALIPQTRAWIKVVLCISLMTMLAALAFTFSRGGYLGLAVALPIGVLPLLCSVRLNRKELYGPALFLVAAIVLGVLIGPVRSSTIQVWHRATATASRGEPSAQMHLDLWSVAVAIARDHSLLGTGQETFPKVFPAYRDRILAPDRAAALSNFRPESPHNAYLAIADGAGVPALVAFFAIIGGFFVVVVRAIPGSAPGEWRRIALCAVLAGAAGHLVTDAFMTAEVTSSWLFWILLGAGFALAAAPARSRKNVRPDGA